MTWLVLACDHRLLLPEDYDEEGNLPSHEHCPKCRHTERIAGFTSSDGQSVTGA